MVLCPRIKEQLRRSLPSKEHLVLSKEEMQRLSASPCSLVMLDATVCAWLNTGESINPASVTAPAVPAGKAVRGALAGINALKALPIERTEASAAAQLKDGVAQLKADPSSGVASSSRQRQSQERLSSGETRFLLIWRNSTRMKRRAYQKLRSTRFSSATAPAKTSG